MSDTCQRLEAIYVQEQKTPPNPQRGAMFILCGQLHIFILLHIAGTTRRSDFNKQCLYMLTALSLAHNVTVQIMIHQEGLCVSSRI